MVWGGTLEPSKWLATGFTASLWSFLSVWAYRSKTKKSRTFIDRIGKFPEFLATIERRAEQNARVLDYTDLAHYLDNKANQPKEAIATDLRIPSERVPELLKRRFPQGVPIRGKLSPKDRRDIRNEVLAGKMSKAEIARRYEIHPSTVSKLVKDYENREGR